MRPDAYHTTQDTVVGACNFNSYIALGDSYAAGIDSQPDGQLPLCAGSSYALQPPYSTSVECARNYGAYPWQFSQIYAPDRIQFMACSGANTTTCEALQVLPTLHALTNDHLITITIGGNNGDAFFNVVMSYVYVYSNDACNKALAGAQITLNTIVHAFNTLFGQIHGPLNPRVVVLGYARFWPAGPSVPSQCQAPSSGQPPTRGSKR